MTLDHHFAIEYVAPLIPFAVMDPIKIGVVVQSLLYSERVFDFWNLTKCALVVSQEITSNAADPS